MAGAPPDLIDRLRRLLTNQQGSNAAR